LGEVSGLERGGEVKVDDGGCGEGIEKEVNVLAVDGVDGFGGWNAVGGNSEEKLLVVVAVVGAVALWKSSKSSSASKVLDATGAFPFPLVVVVVIAGAGGSSSSKLNKSFSCRGGGGASSFFDTLLGTELLALALVAPPSSNSSYSSYCCDREGRSWKSLPPYPLDVNPPPSPTSMSFSHGDYRILALNMIHKKDHHFRNLHISSLCHRIHHHHYRYQYTLFSKLLISFAPYGSYRYPTITLPIPWLDCELH
jgi:hypothetical protein